MKNSIEVRIEGLKVKAKTEKQNKILNEKNFFVVPKNLLGSSTKTEKGDNDKFATRIMYLAPASMAGYNTCSKSTIGCATACLHQNANLGFTANQIGTINKTKFFYLDRENFMKKLIKELHLFQIECEYEEIQAVIRINGTSDLSMLLFKNKEGKNICDLFPSIMFYDYTKVLNRFSKAIPSNYYLTASRDETNEKECIELLKKGFNVAMVFKTSKNQEFPTNYKGFKVVDGEKNDLRHLDYLENTNKEGVIVGLQAKHKARSDKSGFVIDLTK